MLITFLALRHIKKRPLQSSLTVLGVAVGVMVLITALSLTNGFIDELVKSTLKATPHITLTSYNFAPITPDNITEEKIQNTAGVTAFSPFLTVQALVARRANASQNIVGRRGFAQIIGIDPSGQQAVLELTAIKEHAEELTQRDSLVLGKTLAQSLGVFKGDPVMVADIDGTRRMFTMVGTFKVGNELIDSVIAYTSLETLQDFSRKEGRITGYHIRTKDPQDASRLAFQLGQSTYLLASSWQNIFGTLIQQMRLQKALISVVVFLIVLVAAMGIANILILTVSEKTEEIAILRALGTSQRAVVTIFVLEGFFLGAAGTLLGAALGIGLSLYFKFQPYPLPGDLYYITQLPVELQPFDFIWVCGLSLLTSIAAGAMAAKRASGLEPALLLR